MDSGSEKEKDTSNAAEICSSIEHEHRPKECEEHRHLPGEGHNHRVIGARRLRIVVVLTGAMMAAEFIGGYLTRSIALTSDAGHMLTHFSALLISLVAMKIAEGPACQRRSFGLYRVEILAALANSLILTVMAGVIIYTAFQRFFHPEPIKTVEMLMVASVGLIVNLVSMAILLPSSHTSLNIRSAALHMLGDTLSSVSVVVAGIVMLKWKFYLLDPIVGTSIGIVILIWALSLMRESVAILLESTPKQIDIEQVASAIKNVGGVIGIHDIHVWEITTRMYAMSAHVKVGDIKLSETETILARICDLLNTRFDITHTNIQFER